MSGKLLTPRAIFFKFGPKPQMQLSLRKIVIMYAIPA